MKELIKEYLDFIEREYGKIEEGYENKLNYILNHLDEEYGIAYTTNETETKEFQVNVIFSKLQILYYIDDILFDIEKHSQKEMKNIFENAGFEEWFYDFPDEEE